MILALLVGAGMLLLGVLFYGMATALIVRLLARWARTGHAAAGFWAHAAVMMAVTLITAAAHLIEIALWAVVLLLCGEVPTFEKALYASGQYYTALGYGDVILSERWRLLGPLEAVNGLLLVGLSTALMFAVLSRLITPRFHEALGPLAEQARNRSPLPAVGEGDADGAKSPLSGDRDHAG
jgi:hypothetical protein